MQVMPNAPTIRMRTLAARWLTDTITLSEVTFPTDTRPIGKATESESGLPLLTDDNEELTTDDGLETLYADEPTTMRALIRQDVVALTDGATVRRDVRELRVWVDESDLPKPGQRMTINACGDPTLIGRYGQVISVERDSIRAVRRLTVRLGNDD